MAILLLCLLVAAWVVYRDMIAPLRETVAQSRKLLERREKLSALGLVAAGLAHEIRNPLNSIKARLYTQRRLLGAGRPGGRGAAGEIFSRAFRPGRGGESSVIETEALEFVAAQPWPGNVRQLGNVVRQALLLAAGFPISAEHVRLALNRPVPSAASATPTFATRLEELLQAARRGELEDVPAKAIDAAERMIFLRAFELADGNQAKAARWLGVARQTVREKLLHFGHRPGPGSGPA